MMKRYNKLTGILSIGVLSLSFYGCSEDIMDRINKDKDHTTSVASKFILTDVITSTAFSNAGGDLNTYASAYVEYEVGVESQLFYAETRGSETTSSSTYNNTWNGLYSSLKNARIIIKQCSDGGRDAGNNVTKGMAEVLAAYNCALLADFFGDAPCSQASLVDERGLPVYMTPKMDKQAEIYTGQVMKYLDDAIIDLQDEDIEEPGNQDFLYEGNADLWLKFAYGLKARYTMRLLNRSTNKDADLAKVLEYISKSFQSAGEQAAFALYDANNMNPFYGYYNSRAGLGASQSMCEKLIAYSDPRAPRAFFSPMDTETKKRTQVSANNNAILKPAPNGTPTQGTTIYGVSAFVYSKTAPTLLLSYHELLFLKAEALCRMTNYDATAAEAVLKDAVTAGLLNAEKSIAIGIETFKSKLITNGSEVITKAIAEKHFDDNVKDKFTVNPLKETMIQKYLALWGASGEANETYHDIRRMKGANENFISLKNTGKFPLRYTYGNSDTTTNSAVKEAYGNGEYVFTEAVWWAGGKR